MILYFDLGTVFTILNTQFDVIIFVRKLHFLLVNSAGNHLKVFHFCIVRFIVFLEK